MAEGRVQDVFPDKGYGFIRPDDGGEDLFFHFRDVRMLRPPERGQVLTYSVAAGRGDGRKRATKVSEPVVIFDPAALTTAERETAEWMLELLEDPDKFDEVVLEYVRNPTERMQRALQSTDLAEPVLHALHRLSHRAERALVAAKGAGSRDTDELVSDQRLLGMERTRLKPLVNLAYGDAAAHGVRRRAERLLGKVRNPELRAIIHDLNSGMSEDDAKAAAAIRAKATV